MTLRTLVGTRGWTAALAVGALVLGGCGAGRYRARTGYRAQTTVYQQQGYVQQGYVQQAPPPPRQTYMSPQPYAGAQWVEGHWEWNGAQYMWVDGYWTEGRAGYVYAQPRWEQRGGGHVYVEGGWQGGGTVYVQPQPQPYRQPPPSYGGTVVVRPSGPSAGGTVVVQPNYGGGGGGGGAVVVQPSAPAGRVVVQPSAPSAPAGRVVVQPSGGSVVVQPRGAAGGAFRGSGTVIVR
jgi:hypothetical protein